MCQKKFKRENSAVESNYMPFYFFVIGLINLKSLSVNGASPHRSQSLHVRLHVVYHVINAYNYPCCLISQTPDREWTGRGSFEFFFAKQIVVRYVKLLRWGNVTGVRSFMNVIKQKSSIFTQTRNVSMAT